jgi:hypothetical protein
MLAAFRGAFPHLLQVFKTHDRFGDVLMLLSESHHYVLNVHPGRIAI